MFEKALAVGGGFDWISPLVTLILNFRRRPAVTYLVPADTTWTSTAIARLLRDRGVQVWGVEYEQDSIVLHVRRAQAEYAQYWLERNGIPYTGGVAPCTGRAAARMGGGSTAQAANTKVAGQTAPARSAFRLDGVLEWIDRAADRLA